MRVPIKATARQFRGRIALCRAMYSHPRTPRLARWLLWAAVAYALSPIDLIPDFIPVVGHLDDVIIVPLLMILAMRIVPDEVIRECEKCTRRESPRIFGVR